MSIYYSASLTGLFFQSPVGQLHRNIYTVLEEAAQAGAAATAANLTEGRGYVTGALQASIEPRMVKAGRFGSTFQGRARVIAGAKGAAPGELRNRAASATVQRKYRYMFRGGSLLQAWLNSERGRIEAILAQRLS
jgi:hypothetical protein